MGNKHLFLYLYLTRFNFYFIIKLVQLRTFINLLYYYIMSTTLQTKIDEYNYSNSSTPLTQENIQIALLINNLRLKREIAVLKKDDISWNKLTEELDKLADNNNQARFFAYMIKG